MNFTHSFWERTYYFSGELSAGLGKVSTRFVEEMVYGISSSGSVRLTEVSRALEEDVSQHATHKRLSRNLAREELKATIGENILKLGASRIKDRTLLIVDPSDLQKRYVRKMEYLARVRDGSEGSLGRGYWTCEVVGCEVGLKEIIPLAQELWSQDAPDFVSENEKVLSLVGRVRKATGGKGVVVYDRGGDRRKLLIPWTKDAGCELSVSDTAAWGSLFTLPGRGEVSFGIRGTLQDALWVHPHQRKEGGRGSLFYPFWVFARSVA